MPETYAKDIIDKSLALKNKDTIDVIAERSQAHLVGTGIGAGVGLLFGYTKKYSLIISALMGAVVGFGISSFFLPSKSDLKQ